jgi:AcrR family transcriptional regulator
MKSSMKLFADKGFDGTSMRDIAKAVGITLPTIYYYFSNKEGLYGAVLQQVIEKFIEATATAAVGVEGIREMLVAMGMAKHRFIAENREMMLLYLREMYSPKGAVNLNENMEKGVMMLEMLVREGIEKGELRQVDPNIAAWYLTGVFSTYDMRIVGSGRLPSEKEIRTVVDLALGGLLNV